MDEFILTNVLPDTVSVKDTETPVKRSLILNITRSPREGFLANLNDETKSVDSFLQQVGGCLTRDLRYFENVILERNRLFNKNAGRIKSSD